MSKFRKILITGGAGFIGSHLSLELVAKGYEVTVLDNLSTQIHGAHPESSYLFSLIQNKTRFLKGDVTQRGDWESALKDQDAVIHLAAETGTGQSMYKIHDYTRVNIDGTALLLDILANSSHSIKKIIVASSRAIYGEGRYYCTTHGEVYPQARSEPDLLQGNFECKCPVCHENVTLMSTHEDSKIHPLSVYGLTKYNQEQLVLMVGKSLHIPAVAFRYQNVYGPGQSLSNPYTGILSIFSTQIKNNQTINIFEDGKESRDFVHVSDVVSATISGLENPRADYQVYNVGTGKPVNVETIARTLTKLYHSQVNIQISGNFRLGDIRHNFADLTQIKKDLDFEPRYGFEEGVADFTQWVDSQEIKENNYSKSIAELKERGLYK